MNRDQIIELLQLIRVHDNRQVDEPTIQVFVHAAQRAGWDLAGARQAVIDHFAYTEGIWLMPGHITNRITALRGEALRNLSKDRRVRMENACHALQDMGYTPNQAHKFTRAVELGQDTELQLTDPQWAELRARVEAREQLNGIETDVRENPLRRIIKQLEERVDIDRAAS